MTGFAAAEPDRINRRLTLGIFLAAAGRGGAYLMWLAILCPVAFVIAKSLDGMTWVRKRGKRTACGQRRTTTVVPM